jgi:hypothetical protein
MLVYDEKGHCRLSVSTAYEIAAARVQQEVVGHPPGHYINSRNELVPIANPEEKPQPKRRKLMPVSIEALSEVEGNVDEAETHEPEYDPTIEQARANEFSASLGSSGYEAEIEESNPESRRECDTETQPDDLSDDRDSDSCEVLPDEDSDD